MNYSVFFYEVIGEPKEAIKIAEKALQDALSKLDEIDEDNFRESQSIIELLKENLTLWKEEEEGKNDET